jgi:Helicase conserved C-terminal domain
VTSADVRSRLTQALRLDVIGPEPDEPQISEILPIAPSRWYLSGFLVPWNAPAQQKRDDEDTQGELEFGEAAAGGEDDDAAPEPRAARRSHFPSSMGVSVLVPQDVAELVVTARWGDYKAVAKDGVLTGEWRRIERSERVTVRILKGRADPATSQVPNSEGLEVVTSIRRVRAFDELPGLPAGTMAVSVFLVNRREALEGVEELKDERFVFQAALTVEADRPFVPRPNPRGHQHHDPDERIADLQYRDAMEFAVGHGTSVHCVVTTGECRKVHTRWMPQFEVERVEPEVIEGVELRMEVLAEAPDAGRLRASIANLVERYRTWIEEESKSAPTEPPRAEVAKDLLNASRRAAQRIEDGLALLDDAVVFDAFRLMNRAMAMAARQRRSQETRKDPASVDPPAWRPFQLAFVLMNLRSFVTPTHADRELVDLLFFPTGGGKTEAYLALAAFVILLRRLRRPGPESAGVAVLMRYTLRLLTLDQLSRASTLICALELIRRREGDGRLGSWPFEIGLWVGRAATPNRMGRKGDNDRRSAQAKTIYFQGDTKNRPAPIPLETCPWCGTKFQGFSFQLLPDADAPRELRISCANASCPFRGKTTLPIVAVDEPLFRRLPCFVIATVDKFASLPWVGESGALLGGADRHDATGFYGPAVPGAGQRLAEPLAPPDLIIQDELHLISGPLGTMAGLYETAIDALATREIDGRRVRPKILASTATVRRASDQIRALFTRGGVEVFPPPGLDRRDSFFAKTKSLAESSGRLYIGLAAQGRSLKVVLLKTYLALLSAAQKAWQEAGAANNPADPYMTLVGYFNSLRELGGSRRIVEDEVASRVSAYSAQKRASDIESTFADREIAREVVELTSRESTNRVADAKRKLALPFSDKERVDVALATNMISVGLDITRLGLMVVLGQPKAAAEYIQATSRVGRDADRPGLVVTLLNIHRPRDRSHFERFEAFHAAFYRSVEATSVTPFASRALDRAMPAIVVSLARHTDPVLTPPKGALDIATERARLNALSDILVDRVRAHRTMGPQEEQRIIASVRGRAQDLLDSWSKVAERQRRAGARLVYQPYENADGPALLHDPLDPDLPNLDGDARKFKAPRSLRDIESPVNLWAKSLDNVEVESPAEEDEPL